MNRKQLLILIAVGVVLGALALNSNYQKGQAYQKGAIADAEKLLGDFPVTNVAVISIRNSTNAVTLVKSDLWRIKERDEYPAAAASVIELGRKLWDLKAGQSQTIGESQLGRLGLLPPESGGTNGGTLIELKDKDGKLIRSLLLGKESIRDGAATGKGRWVYRPDAKGSAYLISDTMYSAQAAPVNWLSKDAFKIEKLKSVSVTHPNATNSWKVIREKDGGDLKLADAAEGETLDAQKVSSLGYALSSPYVTDVAPLSAKPEETGMDAPTPVTIETFDGFTYSIKVGKPALEGSLYVSLTVEAKIDKVRTPAADEKPEDKEKLDKEFQEKVRKLEEKLTQEKAYSKWTFILSKWTFDPLVKLRGELMMEKKPEPAEPAPQPDASPINPILNSLTPPPAAPQ